MRNGHGRPHQPKRRFTSPLTPPLLLLHGFELLQFGLLDASNPDNRRSNRFWGASDSSTVTRSIGFRAMPY